MEATKKKMLAATILESLTRNVGMKIDDVKDRESRTYLHPEEIAEVHTAVANNLADVLAELIEDVNL